MRRFFFTIAFTFGRVVRSEIEIEPAASIDWAQVLISIIGRQTAWILFLILFSVLNSKVSDVFKFKRLRGEISSLFEGLVVGTKPYETFSSELEKIEGEMKSLPDLARSIAPHLDKEEQAYASHFAAASKSLAEQFAGNPGDSGKNDLLEKNQENLEAIGVSSQAAKSKHDARVA